MGLKLANPLVPSSSPLTMNLDSLRRLEDAGASAVVLGSLFEEQIEHDADEMEHYLHYGADRFAESLSYFPEVAEFKLGGEVYLDRIRKARAALGIPVIASLNGISAKGWVSYARKMEQAGANGIELNVYFIPTNPAVTARDVEQVHCTILSAVKASVKVPVAMKVSPYFSNMAAMAKSIKDSGADALVMFNRFYQPDINPESLEVDLKVQLSHSGESLLRLRWIAILFGRLDISLAATGGIHTSGDAVKMIMAGADVTMLCSALLRCGPDHIRTVREGMEGLMAKHGYESVSQMKGVMSQRNCPEPSAYERGNYIKVLTSYGPTATFE
jgi:dihydroorotate dehydrogenase (fumarate)